jgi:hypothetical protein
VQLLATSSCPAAHRRRERLLAVDVPCLVWQHPNPGSQVRVDVGNWPMGWGGYRVRNCVLRYGGVTCIQAGMQLMVSCRSRNAQAASSNYMRWSLRYCAVSGASQTQWSRHCQRHLTVTAPTVFKFTVVKSGGQEQSNHMPALPRAGHTYCSAPVIFQHLKPLAV